MALDYKQRLLMGTEKIDADRALPVVLAQRTY